MNEALSTPILSVIIPVYNAEATLDRCMTFVINQELKEVEIICVDDCSTDGSERILRGYQCAYPGKITYMRTKSHCGPGGARNLGLSIARGKYIGFVDSDDWPDTSLFGTIVNMCDEKNADIAIFGVVDEYENILSSRIRYEYREFNSIDNRLALHLLSRAYNNSSYISPMVCQKVYKHGFLQENMIRFPENSYNEDDYFTFNCFLGKCNIIIVPGVYYHYYQRQKSITHSFSKKHIDDLIQMTVNLKQRLMERKLWDLYMTDYYAFCEKSFRSTINTLFESEQEVKVQKDYIYYFLAELQNYFSIKEWLDYIDIERIKRLL